MTRHAFYEHCSSKSCISFGVDQLAAHNIQASQLFLKKTEFLYEADKTLHFLQLPTVNVACSFVLMQVDLQYFYDDGDICSLFQLYSFSISKAVHTQLDLYVIRILCDFCNLYDPCETCDISSAHVGHSDSM